MSDLHEGLRRHLLDNLDGGRPLAHLVARWAAEWRVERSILLWGNVSSQIHLISPGCPRPNSALTVHKSGLKHRSSIHPDNLDDKPADETKSPDEKKIRFPYCFFLFSPTVLFWSTAQTSHWTARLFRCLVHAQCHSSRLTSIVR